MNYQLHSIADIVQSNNALTPFIPIRGMSALPDRFWAKVDDSGECWLWTASLDPCGYGQFFYDGRPRKAHRVAYESECGPIPAGLELDHLCKTRHCVRISHLEAVTHRENLLRGDTFQASNAAKTHCKRGHAFNEKNTHHLPTGGRKCRPCDMVRYFTRKEVRNQAER
jgi:hypothetical protein